MNYTFKPHSPLKIGNRVAKLFWVVIWLWKCVVHKKGHSEFTHSFSSVNIEDRIFTLLPVACSFVFCCCKNLVLQQYLEQSDDIVCFWTIPRLSESSPMMIWGLVLLYGSNIGLFLNHICFIDISMYRLLLFTTSVVLNIYYNSQECIKQYCMLLLHINGCMLKHCNIDVYASLARCYNVALKMIIFGLWILSLSHFTLSCTYSSSEFLLNMTHHRNASPGLCDFAVSRYISVWTLLCLLIRVFKRHHCTVSAPVWCDESKLLHLDIHAGAVTIAIVQGFPL